MEQGYAEWQSALPEVAQAFLTVQNESEVLWVAAESELESIYQVMEARAVSHGLWTEDEEHHTCGETERNRVWWEYS